MQNKCSITKNKFIRMRTIKT